MNFWKKFINNWILFSIRFSFFLKYCLIFLLLFPVLWFCPDTNARTDKTVIQSAAEIDYPPFSTINEHGEADGFSVKLMEAALKAMGKQVVFRSGPWAEVRTLLEQGRIDALPLVGRTPERERLFDFTVPYMSLHGAIVVKNNQSGIHSLSDLRGKKVGVMTGDNAEEFLRRKDRGIDIYTTPTFEIALKELSEGKYDAVVIQRLVALRLIQESGLTDLKIVAEPIEGFQQDFCFAVHEGDRDTLAILNEGLSVIVADGTYRQLYSKWFASMQLPSNRPIIVGGDRNYPPYEFIDENGNPAGYNVDLTKAIAREMGLNIQIHLGNWSERVKALEKGEIDVLQGMFYSTERSLKFNFTQAHTVSHYVAVTRKADVTPPDSVKDLAGLDIVVEQGDLMHDFLKENGLEGRTTVVEDQEKALRGLSEGKHDCAIVSIVTASYLIKKHNWSNLIFAKKAILAPEYCYAIAKGQKAILAKFSEGLKVVEANGDYRRIYDKWLGIYKENNPTYKEAIWYSMIIICLLLFVLTLSFTWSWLLRRQVSEKTRALHQSLDRFKDIFEASNVGKSITLINGEVNVNKAFADFLGYAPEELQGKKWQDITPAEDIKKTEALLAPLLNGHKTAARFEKRYIHKNGDFLWADVNVAMQRNPSGKPQYFVTTIVDIGDQKRSQKRVEHLNNVLKAIRDINQLIVREKNIEILIREGCRLLVDNRGYSFAFIILTDRKDRVVTWAESGVDLSSHAISQKLQEKQMPLCLEKVKQAQSVVVFDEQTNMCASCTDSEARCWEKTMLGARLSHDGSFLGYILAASDYTLDIDSEELDLFSEMAGDLSYALSFIQLGTDHKRSEQKRKKLESQLTQAQKMESIGRLAGGVAHDYNNMLSIIIGYAELLSEKFSKDDPLSDDIREILNAARRSADITRQLLAFARRQTTAPKILDMNDCIGNMIKMLRRLIGEDIDLAWIPKDDLGPVKIDPTQVDQIMANLCVNARDAIDGVGKITIETQNISIDKSFCREHSGFTPGRFILLAVSDNGRGISPEHIDNVFEPFFTTKGLNQGTGLGLSTVYGIVKQNNGFINIYSELGKGTSIKIYLPQYEGQAIEYIREETQDLPRSHGETVLLVEDDPSMLKLGERILKRLNYNVLTAMSPSVAIQLAREHSDKIDILVTDVVMPEMNGKELYEHLQNQGIKFKVLFMSGYTANVIAHRGILEDGINFISKPLTIEEFAKKVRKTLDEVL